MTELNRKDKEKTKYYRENITFKGFEIHIFLKQFKGGKQSFKI